MKKKILILTNDIGGLYSFRFELIQELIIRNFSVYFAAPFTTANEKKLNYLLQIGAKHINISFERRGMNPLKELVLVNKFKEVVSDIKPSLVLSYTIKPNIYGSYACKVMRIPIIINITGLGSSLTTGKFKFLIKKMYKKACYRAAKVFFQNYDNLDFFLKNDLVDDNQTRLIPGSGVNTEKFVPVEKTQKRDTIRFLFIGRLMRDKGIEEFLQAAKSMSKIYSNLEFCILGPVEEEKYKNIAEQQNKSIKYLGVLDDVRPIMGQADCIVNPSYHEGMSNVLLEGGAMGKPLLASNIPGCKEIIDDGVNGFLFEPTSFISLQDSMIKFTNLSIQERELMGQASRRKIKNSFDRSIVVKEYMKEIKAISRGEI